LILTGIKEALMFLPDYHRSSFWYTGIRNHSPPGCAGVVLPTKICLKRNFVEATAISAPAVFSER